jgi:hypothetical protein
MTPDLNTTEKAPSGWTEAASGAFILLWGFIGIAGLLWRPAIWQDDYGLDPGPGLLPLIVITGLLLGGAILLIKGLRHLARTPRSATQAELRQEREPTLVAAALLVSVIVYVLALKSIGFIPATLVFCTIWITAVFLRDGATNVLRTSAVSLAATAAITAAVYVVFQRLIGVPLP